MFDLNISKKPTPVDVDWENFFVVGSVFRYVSYKSVRKTDEFVSWAEDQLGCKLNYDQTQPNFLTGRLSVKGFDRVYPDSDYSFMALADRLLRQEYKPFLQNSRIISVEDSISHMEKTTSPGFPWNVKYHSKGEVVSHPYFVTYVKEFLDNYEPGKLLWSVSQKYELRSIEKIKEGKIRTFMVSPIEHVVGAGQFCLDFNNKFYDAGSNFYTPSVVGCSKFAGGFHRMFRRLSRFPNVYNTDASSFDQSIGPEQLFLQMEFRYDFLSDECKTHSNYLFLRKLYEDVIYSFLLLEDGTIVRKNGGNPSGFVNTIVDNTLILSRLLYYAWVKIMYDPDVEDSCRQRDSLMDPLINSERKTMIELDFCWKRSVANIDYFHDNVSYIVYGDDMCFSVSDEVNHKFNFDSVSQVLEGIGFKLKGNSIPVCPSGLDFLSQTLLLNERCSLYLPVMDSNKVVSSLVRGFDVFDPKFLLLRAYNLRIESWADVATRRIIVSFINLLKTRYSKNLSGNLIIPSKQISISYADIERSYFSDEELYQLYTGLESASSVRLTSDLKLLLSEDLLLLNECVSPF